MFLVHSICICKIICKIWHITDYQLAKPNAYAQCLPVLALIIQSWPVCWALLSEIGNTSRSAGFPNVVFGILLWCRILAARPPLDAIPTVAAAAPVAVSVAAAEGKVIQCRVKNMNAPNGAFLLLASFIHQIFVSRCTNIFSFSINKEFFYLFYDTFDM